MQINTNQLPANAKVWIYTLNKKLSTIQYQELAVEIENLLADWTRHGEDLKASFQIVENAILVIALDQNFNAPGGCSIDKSVGTLKKFGEKHNLDFFNRFIQLANINNSWEIMDLKIIESHLSNGTMNTNNLIYNNIASTWGEWCNNPIELKNAWFSKKLNIDR